eukprot:TRINITY_DN6239_c0_g1_i1.p1 TRINITY_DN6239_c0_g1~~TRINITY_DN6239_c0_g1_i1.p1  ORF type:complete len:651 (-),score=102.90 TRINITY_DN6239_c0_g1_i1:512-2407(-)
MEGDAAASSSLEGTTPRPVRLRPASRLFERAKRLQTAEAEQLMSFFCIMLTVMVDFMGLNIQNPLMPFYAEEFEDAKDMGVGMATSLLSASYALSQFIATPLFGFGSDRFGRKNLLMLSMLGSCLGFFGQAFCRSLVSLCVMRFVTGLFGGSRPVAVAYIGDTVPPEQQPKYTAGLAMGISMSLFLAPALGGSMGLIDLALPCYFQAGCAFVGLVFNYLYLKEPQKRPTPSTSAGAGGRAETDQQPYMGWLFANAVVGGMIMFATSAWITLLPLHATSKLGLDSNRIGLIFGSAGLATALAQFFAFVPMSKCLSVKVIGCIGLPLLAVISLVPLGPNQVWFVVLLVFVHSFGNALAIPGVSMTVNLMAPASVRGGLISLTIMVQAAMRFVSPIVVGPLYDSSATYPFYLIAGAIAIAFVFELALTTRVPRMTQPAAAGDVAQPTGGASVTDDLETEDLLHNLRQVHDQLIVALDSRRAKKAGLHEGKSREQLGLHAEDSLPTKPTAVQQKELGEWFTKMLIEQNFQRWPENVDLIKCLCRNAFPKFRGNGFLNRFDDIEFILESHLMLEQQWEQFVLQKSLVGLGGAAEFDWASLQALASLSQAPSEFSVDFTSKPQEDTESVIDSFVMQV